jgi:hypothetical protein
VTPAKSDGAIVAEVGTGEVRALPYHHGESCMVGLPLNSYYLTRLSRFDVREASGQVWQQVF